MTENKKTILYIIQGFIGAGKSTFSKKLSTEKNAVHLNPDQYVTKLFKKDEYMSNWNKCFDKTVEILWDKTKEYLKSGIDVIFDMGFWFKKDRDFARKVAEECSAECKHIYLFVPDEILKERIVATRPPQWVEIHLQNFEKNKKIFEEPQADENVIIIKNF